ncbi:hypothetical protein BDR26DRAFT_855227 [Obelidium mucronatum]|nr:hypothetical protein BDR26DRAFT_855227 [Obelidium mucronatum]
MTLTSYSKSTTMCNPRPNNTRQMPTPESTYLTQTWIPDMNFASPDMQFLPQQQQLQQQQQQQQWLQYPMPPLDFNYRPPASTIPTLDFDWRTWIDGMSTSPVQPLPLQFDSKPDILSPTISPMDSGCIMIPSPTITNPEDSSSRNSSTTNSSITRRTITTTTIIKKTPTKWRTLEVDKGNLQVQIAQRETQLKKRVELLENQLAESYRALLERSSL